MGVAVTVYWDTGLHDPDFAPGSIHSAWFRVQNQDTVAHSVFVKGQVQGVSDGSNVGQTQPAVVLPGATQNFSVTMTMPSTPGNYTLAGEVYVDGSIQGGSAQGYGTVVVTGSGSGTPAPTPTPVPQPGLISGFLSDFASREGVLGAVGLVGGAALLYKLIKE